MMALLRAAIVSSVVSCALTADMGTAMPTKMTFVEMLVLNSITARNIGGVAVVSDRQIAAETALRVDDVQTARRGLQASGLLRVEAVDDIDRSLTIAICAPEAVAS